MEEEILKFFDALLKQGVEKQEAAYQTMVEFERRGIDWINVINLILRSLNKNCA